MRIRKTQKPHLFLGMLSTFVAAIKATNTASTVTLPSTNKGFAVSSTASDQYVPATIVCVSLVFWLAHAAFAFLHHNRTCVCHGLNKKTNKKARLLYKGQTHITRSVRFLHAGSNFKFSLNTNFYNFIKRRLAISSVRSLTSCLEHTNAIQSAKRFKL